MSRPSLGQTRTHVLVGQEEDARRFRQSRAALESAGQSCLTASRRENCELTAQLGLRSTQAMDRAQTAHLRSCRRRANTRRERPCASPTVRGGRHSRATYHFGFSRSANHSECWASQPCSITVAGRQSSDYPSHLGLSRSVRAPVDGVVVSALVGVARAKRYTQFRSHMARDAGQDPPAARTSQLQRSDAAVGPKASKA